MDLEKPLLDDTEGSVSISLYIPTENENALADGSYFRLVAAQQRVALLTKASKLIIPFFALVGFIALLGMILGLTKATKFDGFFWIILLCNLLGSIIGATGVYMWGAIVEQIECFRKENDQYSKRMAALRSQRERMATELRKLQVGVDRVKADVSELKKQLSAFDELRESLKELSANGEDVVELIDSLNNTFAEMRRLIFLNKKSGLLLAFYDASFWRGGDHEKGLNKVEYERMLLRLSDDVAEEFRKQGDFFALAGADQIIDVVEFQAIVERMLEALEEQIIKDSIQ